MSEHEDHMKKISELSEEEMEAELVAVAKKKKKKTRPGRRKFEGKLQYFITGITIVMFAFHLYIAFFSMNPPQLRMVHLGFILVLAYLHYPATHRSPKHRPSIFDVGFVLLSIGCIVGLYARYGSMIKTPGRYQQIDIILGAVAIILVYEAVRRMLGNSLLIVATVMLLYAYFGRYVPGPLKHSGFSISRIISHLTLTPEGIFSTLIGASASYIYMFVVFGAFLSVTGTGQMFIDFALAISGGSRGGPAKVSVLACGLMGMITGVASANVMMTGTFTIPLMKKTGYPDYYASGIVAAASTGGSIMPPVMGAASFIMADTLGVPYVLILKTAILPAILYYLSLFVTVDLRARKTGLTGIPKTDLPSLKKVIADRGHQALPLFGIIILLMLGYSAAHAAVVAIVLAILGSLIKKNTRVHWKEFIKAIEQGALGIMSIACAVSLIGIVVGIFSLTGAALTFGSAILKMSGGLLVPTLILTMLCSILFGMGMPTSACYIMTSTIAAPALLQLGIPALVAHFFVFYFGILAPVTPPVANASYSAAAVSGADPNKTGWHGLRMAVAGFIIPYMFIFSPELLLPEGIGIVQVLTVTISACIGVFGLGLCMEGFFYRKLNMIERIASFGTAILLIDSGLMTDIAGYGIMLLIMGLQYASYKKGKIVTA